MLSAGGRARTRRMPTASTGSAASLQKMGDLEAAQAAYAQAARHTAPDPASGGEIPGRLSRPGAVCAVRGQPADRLSVRRCRLRHRYAGAAGQQRIRCRSSETGRAGRRQSDLRCRPGRRRVAAGRRFRRPARQAGVNDPGKIQRTTRDSVAVLLQGIPGCRVAEGVPPEGRRRTASPRHCRPCCRRRLRSWCGRPAPMAATISRRSKARTRWRPFFGAASPTATAISSNISTTARPTAISANIGSSSSTARSCPIISRSRTTGRCITTIPTWPITPGCNGRKKPSWAIPPRSSIPAHYQMLREIRAAHRPRLFRHRLRPRSFRRSGGVRSQRLDAGPRAKRAISLQDPVGPAHQAAFDGDAATDRPRRACRERAAGAAAATRPARPTPAVAATLTTRRVDRQP